MQVGQIDDIFARRSRRAMRLRRPENVADALSDRVQNAFVLLERHPSKKKNDESNRRRYIPSDRLETDV